MGSERGYVSVRGLVLLGIVVAAVWVLPLVLLQVTRTEPSAAGATAVGGTATGEPAGATGDSGATGDPVSDPIIEANDARAQAMLSQAIRVSQVYYAEHGSFEGFGPDEAATYDPSVVYGRGAPAADMVAMSVSPTTVVFVTVVDPSGGYLCAAAMGDNITFGRTYATMPAECQGGWD
ncbi:MAG TPA: hypothetical protein VFM81_05950 [Actinomycetota bacterium]|nr:hypothetical protein [Actinomycetota bacterium]